MLYNIVVDLYSLCPFFIFVLSLFHVYSIVVDLYWLCPFFYICFITFLYSIRLIQVLSFFYTSFIIYICLICTPSTCSPRPASRLEAAPAPWSWTFPQLSYTQHQLPNEMVSQLRKRLILALPIVADVKDCFLGKCTSDEDLKSPVCLCHSLAVVVQAWRPGRESTEYLNFTIPDCDLGGRDNQQGQIREGKGTRACSTLHYAPYHVYGHFGSSWM